VQFGGEQSSLGPGPDHSFRGFRRALRPVRPPSSGRTHKGDL